MVRILVVFCASAPLGSWLCQGLAAGLARDGRGVTLVDADTLEATLSRDVGMVSGTGSFLTLLRGGEASPVALKLRGVELRGGALNWPLSWLPARAAQDAPYADAVLDPDPERWPHVQAALRALAPRPQEDHIVLVMAPPGVSYTGFLLGLSADAALVGVDEQPSAHATLKALQERIHRHRKQELPTFLVHASKAPSARSQDLIVRHWTTLPHFTLPLGLDEQAPDWLDLGRAWCQALGTPHPNPLERYRRAADARDLRGAELAFAQVLSQSRSQAMELFEAVCRRRGDLLEGAVGAMLVLANEPRPDVDALTLVVGVAAQHLQLEQPTPLAQLVWAVTDSLLAGLHPEADGPKDAMMLLNAATARLHVVHWRRTQKQGPEALLDEALELISRASGMRLAARHRVRLAVVCGIHAAVTGSMGLYGLASTSLLLAEQEIPTRYLRKAFTVFLRFAILSQRPDIWSEAKARAVKVMGMDPGEAHYLLAIAQAHQGDRRLALQHFTRAIQKKPSLAERAFMDPDMEPLFRGAGSKDYDFNPPQNLQ